MSPLLLCTSTCAIISILAGRRLLFSSCDILAPADCSGWELRLHLLPPDLGGGQDISVAPRVVLIADVYFLN
jgi:hypothetical protein